MNTNQFTQKTMEALQSAQSLAIEHQNQALEPEHLLAALASQENGFIPQLLKRMGVEPSAFAVAAQEKVEQLPIWEGDKIFFKLLNEEHPWFSLKLVYEGDVLRQAVLDGERVV